MSARPRKPPSASTEPAGSRKSSRKRIILPWLGLGFGLVLMLFGIGSAGVGHGTYLPLMLFGAPASVLPGFGFFAAPFWWTLIGWLLKWRQARTLSVLLPLHTVTGLLFGLLGTPWTGKTEQWEPFRRTLEYEPLWLMTGLALYLGGLVATWRLALRMPMRNEHIRSDSRLR